jgi:hypothetical protein
VSVSLAKNQSQQVSRGPGVGVKEVDNGIWLVSFMDYDLGYICLEERTLQRLENPFGPKVLPMSQEQSVTYVSGPDTEMLARPEGLEPPAYWFEASRSIQLSYGRIAPSYHPRE